MKNKIFFYLSLLFVIVFQVGCGSVSTYEPPKLNAYVPDDNIKVVYKEKIVKVGEVKENIEDKYNKIKSQYNFNKTTNTKDNSFALVVGIEKYSLNTPVEYADVSALAFKDLLNKTIGIPKENIITLLNKDATSGQLKAKLELVKELSETGGQIFVYFAGHGVPAKDGKTYLLPSDMSADNIHLEPNLKLDNIYKNLLKSNAKDVVVFLDSCFSGKDDKGQLLYKGVAPVLRVKKNPLAYSKNITVFTAGQSTDFANDYTEKEQRMFTHFLIKELSKGNTNLANSYENIRKNVKRNSLMKGVGYKQIPQLYGNKNIEL
jgi:hypothetical protein